MADPSTGSGGTGWQPGDRAKCVDVGDIRLPLRTIICRGGAYLELGRVYHVAGVQLGHHGELQLDVGAQYGPKLARRFVKVPPDDESAERSAEKRIEVPA